MPVVLFPPRLASDHPPLIAVADQASLALGSQSGSQSDPEPPVRGRKRLTIMQHICNHSLAFQSLSEWSPNRYLHVGPPHLASRLLILGPSLPNGFTESCLCVDLRLRQATMNTPVSYAAWQLSHANHLHSGSMSLGNFAQAPNFDRLSRAISYIDGKAWQATGTKDS